MAMEVHNEMLNFLLPHAHQLQAKYGEFFPFAVEVRTNGELNPLGAKPESEHPPSQVVIDMLLSIAEPRLAAGEILAFAICLDSRLTIPGNHPTDAICCRMWAVGEEPVAVYQPYTARTKLLSRRKEFTYGELVATEL